MDQYIKSRRYTTWQLLKLFWQSDKRFYAYTAFSVMIVMTIVSVAFDVAFSYWSKYFFNALQAYNKHSVIVWLSVFIVLAFSYMILRVYLFYISNVFGLRWRKWMTDQFIERWLEKHDYYYLENFETHTDNPDQRIQEDVNSLVTNSISLSLGFISAFTAIPPFLWILWGLSGSFAFHIGSWNFHIYGYLVWVAVIYNLIGTLITFKIGRPLINLNFEQQRREASFRFAAIDLRSHAENIALYQGEEYQKDLLHNKLGSVLENWFAIIRRQKTLLWFTAGFNQAAVLLPLLVALPRYFAKAFFFGEVMQSIRAFGQIQDALSFLVNSYTQLAEWRAVARRLTTFLDHLQDIDESVNAENHLVIAQQAANTIQMQNVSISTPRGESLLKDINEDFIHGSNYLIKGASGIGKSTLVRAIAGIWPYASGNMTYPATQKIMFLPQKSYMPIGTLAESICFPDQFDPSQEEKLKKSLRLCHLEEFVPRLHETATWSDQFSPGEQQRIAFTRVLLKNPDWVFLDESTSMLDLANEKHLYEILKSELPTCSVVSVGHRPSLDVFHDKVIDVTKYDVMTSPIVPVI